MTAGRVLTSLRNAAVTATSIEDFDRLREKAWVESGFICMRPDEFSNEFVRQGAVNEATKRFGRRMKRGK